MTTRDPFALTLDYVVLDTDTVLMGGRYIRRKKVQE